MTKQEFLDRLRQCLHGKVSPGQVVENLQFYEDYINTEIRKGASEAEVMARLGDPRLLARTIVETQGGQFTESAGGSRYGSQGSSAGGQYGSGAWYEEQEGTEGAWHESQDGARGDASEGAWYDDRDGYRPYNQPGGRYLRLLSRIPAWAWLLFVFLIIVLVVSAVFSLLAAILPILLPILLVLLAVKAFRDWIH